MPDTCPVYANLCDDSPSRFLGFFWINSLKHSYPPQCFRCFSLDLCSSLSVNFETVKRRLKGRTMSSITRRYEWTRFNEGKNGMKLLLRLCGFLLLTAIFFFCTDGSRAQHYSSFVICVLTFSTSSSWGIEAETCKGRKSVNILECVAIICWHCQIFPIC